MARLSEQLALLSNSTVGLLERSASEEVPGLDDGQLVERASESPRTSGECELSSPESSVVETEKIPGASKTYHSLEFYLKIYICMVMCCH